MKLIFSILFILLAAQAGAAQTNSAPINITPTDLNGLSSGSTPFVRKYEDGTTVTLTAPQRIQGNRHFKSWTGCDTVSDRICIVKMQSDRKVTPTFTK